MVVEVRIAGVDVLIDAPDGAAKVRELQQALVDLNERSAVLRDRLDQLKAENVELLELLRVARQL